MKFKSITMENFMRYKGVNTIEFSCDPGKNVTVVLGDNTVGKTTIAQAFRFGLYGAVNMEKWKNADDPVRALYRRRTSSGLYLYMYKVQAVLPCS